MKIREQAWAAAIAENQRARAEAIRASNLDPNDWEAQWVSAGEDGRTCAPCLALHGQRRPPGVPFEHGDWTGFPPFCEGCRCIVRLTLKGFRAGQSPTPYRDALLKGELPWWDQPKP